MIPIQLELRNFMSYGEGHPVLCLDGIHVACLSGPNGHGKSTLLDAMVWALWGEPRGGARAGDDLIRHGAAEMLVSFEFEAAGVRYRTLRRRTRHGKTGTTELHFESWDGDMWRPLSGGSAAETQRIISSTLHMTHDTFVHASFIAQGHADAFMGITPQQRKQVLGEVLDLGQYDLLSETAREERRRSDAEAGRLGALIQNIENELAQREHYVELMRSAAEAEEQAKVLTTRLQSERTALLAEVNQMEILARQAEVRASELRRIEDRIRGLEGQLRDLEGRIVDAQSLAQRGAEIERDYEAYQRLDEEELWLGSRFDPWTLARDDVAAAESAIHRERTRLESQLAVARQQEEELEARRIAAPDLQAEAARLYLLVARFDLCDAELAADREKLETGAAKLAMLRGEGERLKAEIANAEQRRTLLGEHDTCPLCGQLLGADGLGAAHKRLLDECDTTQQRLEKIRVDYGHQSNKVKGLQERVKGLQTELAARPATARTLGEVEARIRQLDQDALLLSEAHDRAAALDHALQNDDYAPEQHALLEPLRARLADIEYDHERHLAVRAERDLLRSAPVQMQKLQLARATLETHEAQRAGLETQLLAARDEAATIETELVELRQVVERLPEARLALTQKETQLDTASRAHIAAARELGEAKQQVDWLTDQERVQRGLVVQRKEALADVSAFTQLTEAFGKNGIQEMIIEKAIPEIEEAANELLTRLTDGRMRVTMNTQRQGRSGGNISTLDVDVSDELGTRPYELFSGGEKFRINFAIRIALSRLLARRAGVPLQMLAIDEGFGSQDRQGCDRLIEAIKAVQDDFARVLIITHLDDLKDAFPVQIEVTKTHSGSTFTIM